jgi:hypothetical protein
VCCLVNVHIDTHAIQLRNSVREYVQIDLVTGPVLANEVRDHFAGVVNARNVQRRRDPIDPGLAVLPPAFDFVTERARLMERRSSSGDIALSREEPLVLAPPSLISLMSLLLV